MYQGDTTSQVRELELYFIEDQVVTGESLELNTHRQIKI